MAHSAEALKIIVRSLDFAIGHNLFPEQLAMAKEIREGFSQSLKNLTARGYVNKQHQKSEHVPMYRKRPLPEDHEQ